MLHSPSLGLKINPPYPPLSGGQQKATPHQTGNGKTPCARRGRIAFRKEASPFYTPLTRGGRGGWFYGVSLSRGLPLPSALSRTFSTSPTRGGRGVEPDRGKNKKAPGGASLRVRPLGEKKGRHPARGCSKGLLKQPLKMGTAATRSPRCRPSRGAGCFREARTGAARCSRSRLEDSNSQRGAVQFALSRGKQPTGNPLFHSSSFSFACLGPRGLTPEA